MKTRARVTVVVLVAAMLISMAVFAPEAQAQSRGRSLRMPSPSAGGLRTPGVPGRLGRSGGGNLFSGPSRSGLSNLQGLDGLLNSMKYKHGYGGWGHDYNRGHDDYWDAYRDVGIANAVVDLIGVLVSAGSYSSYAPVAAPVEVVPAPVTVVPMAPPPPVVMVPAPSVSIQTPGYSAPPYVHLGPPPMAIPYPGGYSGYPGAYPAPRHYSGHRGGYGHYKAPATLGGTHSMTRPRVPAMHSAPVSSRGRISAGPSGVHRMSAPAQRTPVRGSGWSSYRVR